MQVLRVNRRGLQQPQISLLMLIFQVTNFVFEGGLAGKLVSSFNYSFTSLCIIITRNYFPSSFLSSTFSSFSISPSSSSEEEGTADDDEVKPSIYAFFRYS